MNQPHPNSQHSLFAVWRWPMWAWCGIVPLLLVTYFLTYAPVVYMRPVKGASHVDMAIDMLYRPAKSSVKRSRFLMKIYAWEFQSLINQFGPTGYHEIDECYSVKPRQKK